MKNLFILFLFASCIGCGLANSPYYTKSFKSNQVISASVGSSMVTIESGTHNDVYNVNLTGSRWELVYAGIENNTINVDYREYTIQRDNAYIKDGFTQHLKYDLSKSKTIKYKDLQMEIIEANSNEIKFKVL